MSIQAVAWVFDHSESEGNDRLVLLAMANHENEGIVGVSKATLAAEARVSETTVWRSFQALQQLGEIGQVGPNEAPDWWLEIDARRRPRLWKMCRWLALQLETPDGVRGRAGVSQGSRRGRAAATRSNSSSSSTVPPDEFCFQCHGEGWCRNPASGIEGPCQCTKPLAKTEARDSA